MTVVQHQHRCPHLDVTLDVNTVLSGHCGPGADDATILDDKYRGTVFPQRHMNAKERIFVDDYGISKFDPMRVRP
jgi:hypothetical protein